MDKKQYKLNDLSKKYSEFTVPTSDIKIKGKSLDDAGIVVSNICVELSVQASSNSCTFDILNAYDIKERKFNDKWLSNYFTLGNIVDVQLGYIETTPVYKGYISMVTANFSDTEFPRLTIECLDVKGLMMLNSKSEKKVYETYGDAVKKVFNSYKTLAKTVEVDKTPKLEHPIEQNRQSDYEFVLELSKKLNYEFFALGDTVYFREPRKITKPVVEFEWGQYITSFSRDIGLHYQVSEVVVRGYDTKNHKIVEGKADKVKKAGNGSKEADEVTKLLKGSKITIIDESITTAEEAKKRAEAELDLRSMTFVKGIGTCVGIPELIPGRYLRLKDFDPTIDNNYYITGVMHYFGDSGYKTTFYVAVNVI